MKWNKESISEALLEYHRRGMDVGSRSLRRMDSALYSAMTHRFGSYRQAIEAAGLDYFDVSHIPAEPWSRHRIEEELRQLHEGGEPLYLAAMERNHPALAVAAQRYFGSYRQAVEAIGIDYATVCIRAARIWTPRRIMRELKRLVEAGAEIWAGAVKRNNPRLWRAATRYFGSYEYAVIAAGIDKARATRPAFRQWSPDAVIEELRRLEREGQSLAPSRLRQARPSFVHVCARRFGSYRQALDAAGIEYATVARCPAPAMTAQDVIRTLRWLSDKGADIRWRALEHTNPRLLRAANRRFGSYRAAVQAAGIIYPPKKPLSHWTEPRVLQSLRDLYEQGADLRHRSMKLKHMPLFAAAQYYFGSYTNAVAQAQIDYYQVVKRHLPSTARATP
jgi:metal-sulfur cluster biosynthetic enzyme